MIPITLFEVLVALKRRNNKQHVCIRRQLGHKKGREAVALTLFEKISDNYIAIHIPDKTTESVNVAIRELKHHFGDAFSSVLKIITVDNGSEFDAFAEDEKCGKTAYYAHPY